jgi:hypothetical protein
MILRFDVIRIIEMLKYLFMKKLLFVFLIGCFGFDGKIKANELPDVFKMVEGWTVQPDAQYFSPDNLYDYINGASDFYLSYHFKELWVADYKNNEGHIVTLELYHHQNPYCAYGIYVEERPVSASLQIIGSEGYLDSGAAYFMAGNYYVKVFNGNPAVSNEELQRFSSAIATLICTSCTMPSERNWFPVEGQVVGSERYNAENFMGLEGFNGVFTMGYADGKVGFKLFVYKTNLEQCTKTVASYLSFNGSTKVSEEGAQLVNDRYNGPVYLVWKNGVIAGVVGHSKPMKLASKVNELMNNALK